MTSGLEARNVEFAYPRAAPLVEDWSASFPVGSMTALTGASGRGKSTLLYLLGLMLHPSAGHVLVDGVAVSNLSDAGRARLRAQHFGFVFQDAALDGTRTVLDNVTESNLYRGSQRSASVSRALDLLDRFGVDVPPERKPGQVSGGQAQRIALCRALLSNPRVLLADEPTGNLDPGSAHVVVEGLRRHAQAGATVVVVTHSPDVANECDRKIAL
jgi:ABC-type lipoprotein export system ATPase subunit